MSLQKRQFSRAAAELLDVYKKNGRKLPINQKKGNADKIIFEEHEIDTPTKELAEKLHWITQKKSKKKKLLPTEVSLLKICQKIGREPQTIAIWLKLISVDPTIPSPQPIFRQNTN